MATRELYLTGTGIFVGFTPDLMERPLIALDSVNVKDATIWSDDPSFGLGQAVGISSEDFVLSTGGFSSNFALAYPSVYSLRRNFTLEPTPHLLVLPAFPNHTSMPTLLSHPK